MLCHPLGFDGYSYPMPSKFCVGDPFPGIFRDDARSSYSERKRQFPLLVKEQIEEIDADAMVLWVMYMQGGTPALHVEPCIDQCERNVPELGRCRGPVAMARDVGRIEVDVVADEAS